jgi:type II secretory pathway predicted ATPase ExeA
MYEDFFGLKDRPFAITPSADLYFDSTIHRRTLAYLRCGVSNGDSLVVMTGEIGAGKTTLLQALMRDLEADRVVPATLANTQLDAAGVTESILLAFGTPPGDRSTSGLEAALGAHLSKLGAAGRRGLAIVDEAQNLPPDALRQLLRLSTLRPAAGAPLQLLLSGQPGLRARLLNTAADEMGQPVCLFCHVGPLDAVETRSYIEHRLQRLGAASAPAFSAAAFEAIHRATGGIPRRINRLCDRVLLAAYLANRRDIDDAMVAKVDADLRQEFGDPEATSLARRSAAESTAAAPAARAAAPTAVGRAAAPTAAERADVAEASAASPAPEVASAGDRSPPVAPDAIVEPPPAAQDPGPPTVAGTSSRGDPALDDRTKTPAPGIADRSRVSPDHAPASPRVAPGASSSTESAGAAEAEGAGPTAPLSAPLRGFEPAPVRVRRRRSRTLALAAILFIMAVAAAGWVALERQPSLIRDLRAWGLDAFEATRAVVPSARRSSGELTTVRPERPLPPSGAGTATGARPAGAAPIAAPETTRSTPSPQAPEATVRPEAPKPKPTARSETPKPPARSETPKPPARADSARPTRSEAPSPPPAPPAQPATREPQGAEPSSPPPARDQRTQPPAAAEQKPSPSAARPACTEAMSALGLCR